MCAAKGITGGYLPLAATFATQQIFDAFLGEPVEGKTFYHGHTYTGNPARLCRGAGFRSISSRKTDLIAVVARESREALVDVGAIADALRHVGDIRQKGLHGGN